MPAKATVFRWIGRHKEFRDQYEWARDAQAETILLDMVKIADDSSGDYVKKIGVDGKVVWVEDKDNLARCRLQIKTRERLLGRMAPRKYGKR